MNQRNKRITNYFILFSLFLVLGIVYAILQANLQINGTTKIGANTWDIHFENIQVNPNSVPIGIDDTAATIDPNNDCKIDFEVTLSIPGDYYEFTVDIKNDGTMDGMIGSLEKTLKVNNVEVQTVPDYLIYDITYSEGGEILENQLLESGKKLTYKVHLEFNRDIDELPESLTIATILEPTYIQADSRAIAANKCSPLEPVTVPASTPSQPVLTEGLIPVKIANDGTVTAVSKNDDNWYNYQNKQWANAVLVSSTNRSVYQSIANGSGNDTIIPNNEILAYYVWIPRYKYAISEEQKCDCYNDANPVDYPKCYEEVGMLCSEISNPNPETYRGCYDQSLSNEDKTILLNWLIEQETCSNMEEAEGLYQSASSSGELIEIVNEYNEDQNSNMMVIMTFNSSYDIEINKFLPNNKPNLAREINIVFESKDTPKSRGTAVGDSYYTHPAFTFGTEELSGIWVGKFEMSHATLSSNTVNNLGCSTEACSNANGLRILPNVDSLRNNRVSNMWYASRSMQQSGNAFGLSSAADSHMMKNRDWGAVAYLSHSIYGLNGKVEINNYHDYENNSYKTGCGTYENYLDCSNMFGNSTLYPQSTTGNITGIFDMAGGATEYVMVSYSKHNGSGGFGTWPNDKYYDSFSSDIFVDYQDNMKYCTLETCGGQALDETDNWYGSWFTFIYYDQPWFLRGGHTRSGGTIFFAAFGDGARSQEASWRSVLITR